MVKKKNKLNDLIDVVKRLRNPKNGCPWDIQQTSKSLAKYTLEEAYEVIEAIESNNNKELEGELGDLLLQVIYHSVIAAEKKKFSIDDVIDTSVKKMKSRHPHIFMRDESIKTVQDVNDFWETQKKFERKKKGAKSVLDGVSVNLPAVTRSLKLQKRAAKEGFDWKKPEDTLKKVKEELNELAVEMKAKNKKKIREELGDLLLQIVLQSKIAEENKLFSFYEVIDNLCEKLIRRHPFVFANKRPHSIEEQREAYFSIKDLEKTK